MTWQSTQHRATAQVVATAHAATMTSAVLAQMSLPALEPPVPEPQPSVKTELPHRPPRLSPLRQPVRARQNISRTFDKPSCLNDSPVPRRLPCNRHCVEHWTAGDAEDTAGLVAINAIFHGFFCSVCLTPLDRVAVRLDNTGSRCEFDAEVVRFLQAIGLQPRRTGGASAEAERCRDARSAKRSLL